MPVSRRDFIRQVITVGPVTMAFWMEKDLLWAKECGMPLASSECTLPTPKPPVRFIPNEPKVVTRYSARELADPSKATQLKQLRDGVCLLRDLPPTDVLSWTKQIAQHCIHCAPSNADNIHYNWQFLPWHRGLLYFIERAMRKLGKMDDMRLAYWDWENTVSRTLPTIYAPKDQPLYWANRNLTGPRWPLSNAAVNVQPLLALPDFRTFGGTATQRSPVPATFSGPHANVHNAFAPGDMADLQYSPRDPVFYAHHGNIDRLWSTWVSIPGHKDPDFVDAKVYFYDENRVWSYVLFNDLRDTTKLGYKYSSLMKSTLKKKVTSTDAAITGNRLTLSAKVTVEAVGEKFLILENIHLEKLPANAVDFGVFTTQPPAGTAASETTKGFVGKVSRVLSSGHDHHADPLSTVLDVTKVQDFLQASPGGLKLYVAPLDVTDKTTAPAVPLSAEKASIVT
ncbi:MAG TPA: tyrosinase family protein [Thermoanaerobaculia bacterium]|jgi:polyphenol oxidase|nr:tyrosinase family protein [Thermoanaerobaculia bacterium]